VSNRLGCYKSIFGGWRKASLQQALASFKAADFCAILASYPTLDNLELGLSLAETWHLPFIADFRDGLLFDPIESSSLSKHNSIRRHYTQIERQVAEKAIAIVSVFPDLTLYFIRKYACPKVKTIPNGFDRVDVSKEFAAIPAFPKNRVHLVHCGGMAASDASCNVKYLVEALWMLDADQEARSRICIHFFGSLKKHERHILFPLVASGMIQCHNHVSSAQSLALQLRADILLLITSTSRPSLAPGKLFEYLWAHKPILALAEGTYAEKIIMATRVGMVIPANSPRHINEGLHECITNRLSNWYHPNEKLINTFAVDKQMAEYNAYLHKCIGLP
jgi:hypothetical protein